MQTLVTDIAAQMQGAVDELERAFDLLEELADSAHYAHLPLADVARLRCRLDAALVACAAPLPAALRGALESEQAYLDSLDAAADRASY